MFQLMLNGHFEIIMPMALMYLGTKNMDTPHIRALIKSTLRTPQNVDNPDCEPDYDEPALSHRIY